jgi:hypothetical protein
MMMDPVSYTIPGFCEAYHISRAHYYAMRKRGLGPREMAVGGRRIITREAAADWAVEREGSEAA